MSTDLHMLSGAYALDALSAEEAEQFNQHLKDCPACTQEVRELQQAAAKLGASESFAPPASLRAKVVAAADRTPQLPPHTGGNVVGIRRPKWGARFLMAAAAVVLIVAGAVGVTQLQEESQNGSLLAGEVVRVFEAEDAETVSVETANGGTIRVATSPERGEMAVDADELPALDEGQVYQLWTIQDDAISSAGILDREKGAAMELPGEDVVVALTIEPAGGSVQPTTDPIMQVQPGGA